MGYGTAATVGSTVPYGYAASGHYVADSVGAVHVAKREADADADAFYGTYGYSGIGYSSYGYASPSISYAAPSVSYGYTAPVASTAAYGYTAPAQGAAIAVRGYGTAATVGSTVPYGYAASGHYVADSLGAVHVAKREAGAEPEADALYASYGYSGLGYNRLGYGLRYRGLGYSGLGYTRSYGLGYGYPYYG